MLPLGCLALGSWLGMGRPDEPTTIAALKSLYVRGAHRLAEKLAHSDDWPAAPFFSQKPPPLEPASPSPETNGSAPHRGRLNPTADTQKAWLYAEGPAPVPNSGKRYVTFTFDDGPFPETTPTVLNILSQHRVRGTFFFVGRYLDGNDRRSIETRDAAKQVLAAGHIVGNHGADHLQLTSLNRSRALLQIDDSSQAIEQVTGEKPFYFRPAYGKLDPFLEKAIADRGLELVLWSISIDDIRRYDVEKMVSELTGRIEYSGGGIVLLHDIHWASVKTLNRVLHWLDEHKYNPEKPNVRGYEIVDLPEYIRLTKERPQPFSTRDELEQVRRAANPSRMNAPPTSLPALQ